MSETTTQYPKMMPGDRVECRETLSARLEGFTADDLGEARVEILTACDPALAERIVGRTGVLKRIDRQDAALTFYVEGTLDEGASFATWVHRVRRHGGPDAIVSEEDRLRSENARLAREMEEFKTRVRDKAIEVAATEGWCDNGLNAALVDLDLEPVKSPEYEIEVTIKYRLRGKPTADHRNDVSEGWIRSSLQETDRLGLDGDWEDVEMLESDVVDVSYEES